MSCTNDDRAARIERILSSNSLLKVIIKDRSIDIITGMGRAHNCYYEKVWRNRLKEEFQSVLHNLIRTNQLLYSNEPLLDYKNVVLPFSERHADEYNAFLTDLCKGINYDGVKNPRAVQQVTHRLATIFADFDKFAHLEVAKCAATSNLPKIFNAFPAMGTPTVEESLLIGASDKSRVI